MHVPLGILQVRQFTTDASSRGATLGGDEHVECARIDRGDRDRSRRDDRLIPAASSDRARVSRDRCDGSDLGSLDRCVL